MGKGCAVPIKWGYGMMGMMGTLCFAHPTLCPSYVKTTLRMKMGENGSLKGNKKPLISFTSIVFKG